MATNWNEIRAAANIFARDWSNEVRETAEYQTFWNEFFQIFGVRRRTVARYQEKVSMVLGNKGFIDLFWPKTLIAEHKSAGQDLDSAYDQAGSYFDALEEDERPRYIIVTDYRRMRLYDLEGTQGVFKIEFDLNELSKNIRLFGFIAGFQIQTYKKENPINVKAVRAIGRLYEAVLKSNYPRESIDKFLTRIVFCFFADDTGIFNKDTIRNYIEEKTKEDGFDIGAHLNAIFQILDTPTEKRQTTIDEDLASLPYVNGGLFSGHLPAFFGNREIRNSLIFAVQFDWSAISPAIFGSMFQSVLDDKARHDLGAHYTSEDNIMKVISSLFLDDLNKELKLAGNNDMKLETLWNKLARIKLLDPACGCGNFLVVAYRELRRIELEIIKRKHKDRVEKIHAGQSLLPFQFEVSKLSRLSVENMYGIEIESFPVEIAQLSLWFIDHLANIELGDFFGNPFVKLPLVEKPHIITGDSLIIDWESLVPKKVLSYILGNPPFIGSKVMTGFQRNEIKNLFENRSGGGLLDYVSGWYLKAGKYIHGTNIKCAFVSTNSITQGEQVGILWEDLIVRHGINIHFAHRTFKWTNEAPGKAAVYCVVIGFAAFHPERPRLFDYENVNGEPHEITVSHINPYLVDAPDIFIKSRSSSLCGMPQMKIGNKPIDGGIYLFTSEEKAQFLLKEPGASKFFKRWIGSDEFINGYERWCLWLGNAAPEEIREMPEVMRRIEAVRQYRLLSDSKPTFELAATPTHFHVENIPTTTYLLIPRVSSENRHYIPIGFLNSDTLASDSCHTIPDASLYHFGVLESDMHMTWVRATSGRLESRYRYSKDIVYNNFPWPNNPSIEQRHLVEVAAQLVLNVRASHPEANLSDLYNVNLMPKDLYDAHQDLDHVVDRCYGRQSFKIKSERLEFLFNLYSKYLSSEE